jgi:hypothetical protein
VDRLTTGESKKQREQMIIDYGIVLGTQDKKKKKKTQLFEFEINNTFVSHIHKIIIEDNNEGTRKE